MAAVVRSPWRVPLMVLGCLLIALSPFVGVIPGPGGVFVFAGGAVLLIRNSHWAKRRYVAVKRRWPKFGRACDRIMRRRISKPAPATMPVGSIDKAQPIDFTRGLP